MLRNVIGADDRERVPATTSYPYTAVCKAFSYWPDGSETVGSATLVEKRLALTVGHNMHSPARGEWADDIEIVPACRPGTEPFGS